MTASDTLSPATRGASAAVLICDWARLSLITVLFVRSSATQTVGRSRESHLEVEGKMERKKRTVVAGALGVVGAGLILAVAVKALPTVMRGVMSRMMRNRTSTTGAGGHHPADL